MNQETIEQLIRECMAETQKAIDSGNTPYGCLLTDSEGTVLARAHNTVLADSDPSAHAEVNAIKQLCRKLKRFDLPEVIVFANAESCPMCLSCALRAGVTRFYFGARTDQSRVNPSISANELAATAKQKVTIRSGILEKECQEQIAAGYAKLKT